MLDILLFFKTQPSRPRHLPSSFQRSTSSQQATQPIYFHEWKHAPLFTCCTRLFIAAKLSHAGEPVDKITGRVFLELRWEIGVRPCHLLCPPARRTAAMDSIKDDNIGLSSDESRLISLGHKPELTRTYGFWSLMAYQTTQAPLCPKC